MPQRCFYGFSEDFFFCCSFEPEAESRMRPLAHEWHKPSPTASKPGRMIYQPDQTGLARQINHTSLWGVPGFTLPAMFLVLFSFPLFTDFLIEVFFLICLYFRLPPFLRLSVRRIR